MRGAAVSASARTTERNCMPLRDKRNTSEGTSLNRLNLSAKSSAASIDILSRSLRRSLCRPSKRGNELANDDEKWPLVSCRFTGVRRKVAACIALERELDNSIPYTGLYRGPIPIKARVSNSDSKTYFCACASQPHPREKGREQGERARV
jgi:hypothetical protein